jgi:hypothetical protein
MKEIKQYISDTSAAIAAIPNPSETGQLVAPPP